MYKKTKKKKIHKDDSLAKRLHFKKSLIDISGQDTGRLSEQATVVGKSMLKYGTYAQEEDKKQHHQTTHRL